MEGFYYGWGYEMAKRMYAFWLSQYDMHGDARFKDEAERCRRYVRLRDIASPEFFSERAKILDKHTKQLMDELCR